MATTGLQCNVIRTSNEIDYRGVMVMTMPCNIYIDGTWCTPKDNTNIHKLYQKYGGTYFKGPGSGEKYAWFTKLFGGAFGYGVREIVELAHQSVMGAKADTPVNIFGFSRGAAAARMLAGMLAKEGREVQFMGCFDTVGAFGIPINIFGIPFQKINLFHDMKVHDNVLHVAHAQALNEERPAFVGTPMEPRPNLVQKGFDGDHNYVGSSFETLQWITDQLYAASAKPYTTKKACSCKSVPDTGVSHSSDQF
jgi:hypothetical protein